MNEVLKNKSRQSTFVSTILAALLIATAVFFTSTSTMAQGKNDEGSFLNQSNNYASYDLTGTWELTITPDDGSPSFKGFYTFFADGNASFASAGPPIPALGNPGFGVWEKVKKNKFASLIRMISYTPDFQFDGTLKILANIQMTGPNQFVTSDTVKVYDPAGNEIVTLGGSAQGRRIKL